MTPAGLVDTAFDVRSDAGGRDPDSRSKTLRRYHQLLWSKPLPSGDVFELDDRLHHKSHRGEFWLSSDAITHTYSNWMRPARLVEVLRSVQPAEVTDFYDLGCTVGAYVIFPTPVYVGDRWRQSINQARGIHPRIRDRFDLTLECIRRHYAGIQSPLTAALAWYSDFFGLFASFPGYVDHFLLNDLVNHDYASIRHWKACDDFGADPLPAGSVQEYRDYMRKGMTFITRRNERIARYSTLIHR